MHAAFGLCYVTDLAQVDGRCLYKVYFGKKRGVRKPNTILAKSKTSISHTDFERGWPSERAAMCFRVSNGYETTGLAFLVYD